MASLGVLASGVAHEINNPLNFIHGGINGVEMYIEENFNEQHLSEVEPFIKGIKEGVSRAAKIVTSLNHFSRSNNASIEVCNIHTIIDNCLIMLNNNLKYRIEIEKDYTSEPFILECNDGKLHQVILNILSNAEQAIEEKGTISISTKLENKDLVIRIIDSGIGISKDIISKITDPFFTTKEVGKGTGLGLSIAYKIIIENNGTIKHLSEEKKGTEVIITMPVKLP
jgi:signal transduction histidine kinase